MKIIKNFKSNIAIQILAGVFMVLAILTGIVCVIGYSQFTGAIEKQYSDSAYNTARTALYYLNPYFIKSKDYDSPDWEAKSQNLRKVWRPIARNQQATYIYLFQAKGKNYEDVEFITDSINTNIYPLDHEYKAGFKIVQTDEKYLRAFREIYDEHKDRAEISMYRPPNEEFESGSHIAVMIPVKDFDGEIIGILGVERRMEDIDAVRNTYLKHVITVSIIFLVIILTLYGLYLSSKLIKPVQRISKETVRFARENTLLSPKDSLSANIATQNEIGQLAKMIDLMESETINYINNLTKVTKEKEQIKAELNVATQIQADMLPKNFIFPGRDEFEIYATMKPAKEVGGDFYDFFLIDENHLAMVMADVSGKGVPAALFMVIAKTLLKTRSQLGGSPSEILHDVNNQLCEGNEADLFVTVWLGILDLSSGKVVSSNAGHEYPAIKHKDKNYELFITKNSPAVATMEGMRFKQTEFELQPGDYIYLYTDGVAEATNSDDILYGTDRMIEALNKTENYSLEETLKFMKNDIDNFVGDAPQFDDITMLSLKYNGRKNISMRELTIEAEVENLDNVLAFVDEELEKFDCPPKIQVQIDVAVEELFVNIAHYAYKPEKGNATIKVEVQESPLSVFITFVDNGVPYDPLAKPDPDVTLSAEEREVGGLGIFMVKKSMDDIKYEYKDGKNILTITKNL